MSDNAVADLWKWARDRGMTDQQWRGVCVALGYIHGTKNLSLEQYVLLKEEVFCLLGVRSTDEANKP